MHNFINEVPANPYTRKEGMVFRSPYSFDPMSLPTGTPYHTHPITVNNGEIIYCDRDGIETIFEFPENIKDKKIGIIAELEKFSTFYPGRRMMLALCVFTPETVVLPGLEREQAIMLFCDGDRNLIYPHIIRFHTEPSEWELDTAFLEGTPTLTENEAKAGYELVTINDLPDTEAYDVCLRYNSPGMLLFRGESTSKRYALFSESVSTAVFDLYAGSVKADVVKVDEKVYFLSICASHRPLKTLWFECKIIDQTNNKVIWTRSVKPAAANGSSKGNRKLFSAELAKLRWAAGECEAVQQCLDDLDVPREINGEELSLWGRIVQFKLNGVPYEVSGTSVLKEKKNVD